MDYSMKDADENEHTGADVNMDDDGTPYSRQPMDRRRLYLGGKLQGFNHIGANNQAGERAYREDFHNFLPAPGIMANNRPGEDINMDDADAPFSPQPTSRTPANPANREALDAAMRARNQARQATFTPINADRGAYEGDEDVGILSNPAAAGWESIPITQEKGKKKAISVVDLVSETSPLTFSQIFARHEPNRPQLNDKIQKDFDVENSSYLTEGGEGKIYLAEDHRSSQVRVIKYIKHPKYFDEHRCPNEIEQLTSLGLGYSNGNTHENIVKILEWYSPVGTSPDCAYVMEFFPLDDLEKFTWAHFHGSPNKHARPHEALLRSLYIDLLQGLEFLHAGTSPSGLPKSRIIHGDIKPKNILLGPNYKLPGHWTFAVPTAKLADFGGATAMPVFKKPLPYPDFKAQNWQYSKLRQIYTQNWAAPEALPPDHGYFGPDALYARLMPSTDVYSVAASINFVMTASPAKKGGGFQDKSLSIDYYGNRDYWRRGREKGDKWWDRNVTLVANNGILPPDAQTPPGASTQERRKAYPSARAKSITIAASGKPVKEYSLLFMKALERGFDPDVKKRADVQTLLGWLRLGFDDVTHALVHNKVTPKIDEGHFTGVM